MKSTNEKTRHITKKKTFIQGQIKARSLFHISALFSLLFIAFMLIIPSTLFAEEKNDYLVLFNGTIDETVIDDVGATVIDRFDFIDVVQTTLTESQVNELQTNEVIASVELNHEVEILGQRVIPEIDKIGTKNAWKQGLTGKGVKVAVLDTGVSKTHPDLRVKKGFNFIDDNNDYDDDHGHGSHVAGIINAGHSETGMRGMAPSVELYAGKIMNQRGEGTHSNIIKGIEWAINQNVDIINLSVGSVSSSDPLKRALQKANDQDILLVAAAGNSGANSDLLSTVEYPAKYDFVIAVAAVDQNDRRASFSAYGPEIDVAAPGINIYSTHIGTTYDRKSGTSMAAPLVTGMLAIMKEATPSKTSIELRNQLTKWVLPSSNTPNHHIGHGRIQFPTEITIEERPPEPVHSVQTKLDQIAENEATVEVTWKDDIIRSSSAPVTYLLKRDGKQIYEGTEKKYIDRITKDGNYKYSVIVKRSETLKSPAVEAKIVRINLSDRYSSFINEYDDIKSGEWYVPFMSSLVEQKLITGYPDKTLRPNRLITRAEATLILGRYLGWDLEKKETIFTDVAVDHFASGAIAEAEKQRFLNGYDDGSFKPNVEMKRGELSVLFERIFTNDLEGASEPSQFTDVKQDDFFRDAVRQLTQANIVQGYQDGTFRPRNSVTRGEFAAFLVRTIEHISE